MVEAMPSLKNISWDRLVREESVTFPVDGTDVPGNEILFAEGFPTKDGRAQIVPAGLVPPAELPDDDYPLVLTDRKSVVKGKSVAVRVNTGGCRIIKKKKKTETKQKVRTTN